MEDGLDECDRISDRIRQILRRLQERGSGEFKRGW